jgi:peroxiredoxin
MAKSQYPTHICVVVSRWQTNLLSPRMHPHRLPKESVVRHLHSLSTRHACESMSCHSVTTTHSQSAWRRTSAHVEMSFAFSAKPNVPRVGALSDRRSFAASHPRDTLIPMMRSALHGTIVFSVTLGCASSHLLAPGMCAPDFRARDQSGRERTLVENRGHTVVLFFYPRDGTPGCTREACSLRDVWNRFEAVDARVLGVSTDDVASHATFAREHHLTFPLLADPDSVIVRDIREFVRDTFASSGTPGNSSGTSMNSSGTGSLRLGQGSLRLGQQRTRPGHP